MAELSPRGQRLRRQLLYHRDRAGLSGRKLAEILNTSQGTIWRIDNGHQLPTIPVVRDWLDACDVKEPARRQVLDLVEALHGETRPWGDLLAGVDHLQGVARQREAEAGLVRNFQPTIVPGLLQTPEYAARIIPLSDHTGRVDHDAALTARLQRQQVLYEDGHQFQFLLVESALRWSATMGEITRAQLDRIVSLSHLGTVDVAVIQAGHDVVIPWHNFTLWEPTDDDPYVTTELFHGEQRIGTTEQVQLYQQLWQRMWPAAAAGDDAVELIQQVV